MGMDVHGKTNGTYFRRSVWGWHPLADYIIDMHPDIAGKVSYWHTNDGDGLDEQDAHALAAMLRQDLEDGTARLYIDTRNDRLGRLPRQQCELCHGTGLRTDAIGVQYGYDKFTLNSDGYWKGGCNGCNGTGTKDPWDRSYPLELSDLEEFAQFLESCDGFCIW